MSRRRPAPTSPAPATYIRHVRHSEQLCRAVCLRDAAPRIHPTRASPLRHHSALPGPRAVVSTTPHVVARSVPPRRAAPHAPETQQAAHQRERGAHGRCASRSGQQTARPGAVRDRRTTATDRACECARERECVCVCGARLGLCRPHSGRRRRCTERKHACAEPARTAARTGPPRPPSDPAPVHPLDAAAQRHRVGGVSVYAAQQRARARAGPGDDVAVICWWPARATASRPSRCRERRVGALLGAASAGVP